MDFILTEEDTIIYTIDYYCKKSGIELDNQRRFEDKYYKAIELFRYKDHGQICAFHLDAMREYYGVPAWEYLFKHQFYLTEEKHFDTMGKLKNYLSNKHPLTRSREPKFNVWEFRRMIGNMR
ncbi:MAG: hypothetical protein MJZ86_10495 [Bacteroidales bacterium]|nr:hypothetical protein [Bacteroidales bacterium]